MEQIITRFPPSPTGYLHVGGARTALFNWLYARSKNGRFVLRIEDTDIARSTKESVDAIFKALDWLGIDWDDGPFYQSERLDIYKEYIQKLIDSDNAYYCTCSPEKIKRVRESNIALGQTPKYDGTCRDKRLKKSDKAVVRFRADNFGTTIVEDIIKGNILFQNSEIDDFIIQRSDGMPMYNFAVVVDDITMGINTVLRGDDHVSNTPKQIALYRALGCLLPVYGHVPMVFGKDRTRLSKRHGAMSVTAYKDMGYMPEALINYLVRLGWSHGDDEFFLKDDLIKKFNIKNIGISPSIFDSEKLLSLNADHIKAAPLKRTAICLKPFLEEKNVEITDMSYLSAIAGTLNKRSKTLLEMADGAMFYLESKVVYDKKAAEKFLKLNAYDCLSFLIDQLKQLESFTQENQEEAFKKVMDMTGLKFGKIAQPVRVALTGKTVSPGIFEIIEVLGKERVIKRLEEALLYIDSKR